MISVFASILLSGCEALVVANQEWLSDAQIAAIAAYAKDGGRALMDDLAKTGWHPAVRVENVPPQVFVEYKRLPQGFAALFMNYDPSVPVRAAKIVTASGVSDVPDFGLYRFAVERNAVFNGKGK